MKKIAVFPGSFDPITKGHEELILKGAQLFDEIIVALGTNTSKTYLFSQEQRLKWIEETFRGIGNIRICAFEGLTIDLCKKENATYLLRGIRNSLDLEYEKSIAAMNQTLAPEIETVFLFPSAQVAAINSTIVRELLKNNTNVSAFIPDRIKIS